MITQVLHCPSCQGTDIVKHGLSPEGGSYLRRDNVVSVLYSEGLNSTKSSATLQRTDRHGILGQKPAHLQVSL